MYAAPSVPAKPQQCPELTGEVSDSVKSHRPRGVVASARKSGGMVRRRNWLGAWGLLWCCACRDWWFAGGWRGLPMMPALPWDKNPFKSLAPGS